MNQIDIAVDIEIAPVEVKEITLEALAMVAGGFDGYNLY